jgi:hypothetical protein
MKTSTLSLLFVIVLLVVSVNVFADLSVSLSEDTPVASIIPYNGVRIEYTTIALTASSDPVELTGVTVERSGLGLYSDFDKVYIVVDGTRYGPKISLDSDNEVFIPLLGGNSVLIPSDQTVCLSIMADMDAIIGQTPNVGSSNILELTGLTANSNIVGDMPIIGNPLTISLLGVPTVDFQFEGNNSDIEIDSQQVVCEFSLENTSPEEFVLFDEIALKNIGTANEEEVINYTLYNDSDEIISGPVNSNNDIIVFLFEGICIEDGDDENYTIKADIQSGASETVILDVNETTDVSVVGFDNGFYASVSLRFSSPDIYVINSGALLIDEANDNPGEQNVAVGEEGVVFLRSEWEATTETIVVEEFALTVNGTNPEVYSEELLNIRVTLDGVLIAGPEDYTGVDGGQIIFNEGFEVSGTCILEVTAEIGEVPPGIVYSIDIEATNIVAENMEGDMITPIGSAFGHNVHVGYGLVFLVEDLTFADQDIVVSNDILIGKFKVWVGEHEGVNIDRYTIDISTSDQLTLDNIEELYINFDEDVIDQVSSSNNFYVNRDVEAGSIETVEVYASFNDNFVVDGSDDTITTTLDVEATGLISDYELTISPVGGQTMTFVHPSLILNVSPNTPDADIVIMNTIREVAEWEFEAEHSGYEITEVIVTTFDGTGVATSDIEPSAVIGASLNGIEATSILNGVIEFSDIEFRVEADDELSLDLLVTYNDVDNVNSGTQTEFVITGYSYIADNNPFYEVDVIGAPNYSRTNEIMFVRNTEPIVSTDSGDIYLTANTELMEVTIEADSSFLSGTVNNQVLQANYWQAWLQEIENYSEISGVIWDKAYYKRWDNITNDRGPSPFTNSHQPKEMLNRIKNPIE